MNWSQPYTFFGNGDDYGEHESYCIRNLGQHIGAFLWKNQRDKKNFYTKVPGWQNLHWNIWNIFGGIEITSNRYLEKIFQQRFFWVSVNVANFAYNGTLNCSLLPILGNNSFLITIFQCAQLFRWQNWDIVLMGICDVIAVRFPFKSFILLYLVLIAAWIHLICVRFVAGMAHVCEKQLRGS